MADMARVIPRMPGEDEPIPAELRLRCINCGYELTGLISRCCPECGEIFDPRETWLENERSTWAYHFENVCTKWDYARLAYLAFLAICFFALAGIDIKTLLAVPMVVLGELYILWMGGSGMQVRMSVWTLSVLWGVLVAMLAW